MAEIDGFLAFSFGPFKWVGQRQVVFPALPGACCFLAQRPYNSCLHSVKQMVTMKIVMTEPIDKLINELEKWREKQNLSPAELAKLLGVSRQAIYYWLSRKRIPSGDQVLAIQGLLRKEVRKSTTQP